MYLPFKPLKGIAFRIYFTTDTSSASAPADPNPFTYIGISKDGGQFTETSGTPTQITTDATSTASTVGCYYLDLTASEMDASAITIRYSRTSVANGTLIIYTTVSELAAAPTSSSSISDKITAIFQYLYLKRTVTSTQEKLYKADGSTVLATGTISDDGNTFTKGLPA